MTEIQTSQRPPSQHPLSPRPLRKVAIQLLSLGVGIIGGAVLAVWLATKSPPPDFTDEQLTAAQEKWNGAKIENYDLTVNLSGQQKSKNEVQVRSGKVTKLLMNGREITNRGSQEIWSIDGIFKVIQLDRMNCSDPRVFGVESGIKIFQQAEFDPELGYPRRYRFTIPQGGRDVWMELSFRKVE